MLVRALTLIRKEQTMGGAMGVGKTIQNARRTAGLTETQIAELYDTQLAPWPDECQGAFEFARAQYADLPDAPACQCCGTPFDVPNMPFGTNADGTENPDYCGWCYQNGEFTSGGLDEIIEHNVPYLMQATGYSQEEAVSFMGAVLPTLKHWRQVENRNVAGNLHKSVLYVCPSCGNVVWSSGEAVVSCCGDALEPLVAKANDGLLSAEVEVTEGIQRVRIAHPMTKDNHLLFVAAVGDDLVRIKRLYPEQEARAEFYLQGPCKIYAYGASCGLVKIG